MLTQRADEIIGQVFAFMDISADFTYPTLFTVCLRFGFHVFLIICVGHGIQIGKYTRLGHGADEDTVAAQINVLFHLQGEESVDITMQESQPVIGTQRRHFCKLIYLSAGLETEVFKNGEGCIHRQTVNVHNAGFFDDIMGVILFVDAHSDTVRVIGQLCNSCLLYTSPSPRD